MQRIMAWLQGNLLVAMMVLTIGGIALVVLPFVVAQSNSPSSTGEAITQEPGIDGFESMDPGLQQAPEQGTGPKTTPTADVVIVYISGAVRRPETYVLPAAARVKDVVLAAGGLSDDADPDQINLAEHVSDGQHIIVPHQGDLTPADPASDDTVPATDEQPLLNINTASAAQLDGLPGIGQVYAQRIVEYRTANGPFQAVEDLRNVKGISTAIFAKIAEHVTVGP